ncbi:hypothetical protein PO124_18315 [Bacillus licheniformis]|nr:hypothetical protein [Bacillus licheniformis]
MKARWSRRTPFSTSRSLSCRRAPTGLSTKMVVKWFNQLASHNKTYREWDGLYHEISMSLNGKTF